MNPDMDTWFGERALTLQELERAHINRRIIEFALFARELPKFAQAAGEAAVRTTQFYQTAKQLSPGILAAIANEPQFHYWTVHALHLLRRLKVGEPVPAADTPHLESVANYNRDPLGTHVKDFGRFLLAAALLGGEPYETTVPLHRGHLHLPGLNIILRVRGSAPEALVAVRAGGRAVTVNGESIDDFDRAMVTSLSQEASFTGRQVMVLPFVRRLTGSFALNAIEPYWERTWVARYRNPNGSGYQSIAAQDHASFAICIAKAMDVLADCWPEMEANIASHLRVVIPVRSTQPDVHMSCSSDVFRFALLMSEGTSEMLAEALIHEFGHNVLNIIIEQGAVFEGSPPPEEILYSPWRPDARPISGVMHGAYVFERVCEFYRRYLANKEDQRIRERYSLMTARLHLANEVLAGCHESLAQDGISLINGIQQRAEQHSAASGALWDKAIRFQLRQHYQVWEAHNPAASRPVGKLISHFLG